MSIWIENNGAFAELCRQAAQYPCIALDTEFIWSSTFYPRLALIQLSWGQDHCALIDPLAISDPTPLAALLANANIRKILHEAPSDLPILRRWCGETLPESIFDTRLAGAFCGLGLGCSLNKLLTELLQVTLDKSETRSDWLQRPLSERQLQYAAEDVIRLPELAKILQAKIEEHGNQGYFDEEMQIFSQAEFYRQDDPRDCWRRVGGSGNLDPRRLAILRELAAWRETTARELDIPRPRILKDGQLLDIVNLRPEKMADLRKVPAFWPKYIQRYGEHILEAVQRGQELPLQACPVSPEMNISLPVYRKRVARIQALVKKRSESRGIDPALVAPRREISSIIQAAEAGNWAQHQLMQGWRKDLLGETFANLIKNNFQE
jgi:ribonuclease D